MTAGSGIIHQEMPQASERMLGLQLWVNLPRRNKMTEPQYRDITAASIPKLRDGDAAVAVVSGRYGGAEGPTQGDYVKVLALDVALKPGSSWRLETEPESTVFVYLFEGSGAFGNDPTQIESHRAILFGEGEELAITAGPPGLRFMLFAGRPLREPVAWGGPIVMNTREELRQAFAEIDSNTFIRHPR